MSAGVFPDKVSAAARVVDILSPERLKPGGILRVPAIAGQEQGAAFQPGPGMGSKHKPSSRFPLPQAQLGCCQAAPESFIQIQPVFPFYHQAAKAGCADIVDFVHHIVPVSCGGIPAFVRASRDPFGTQGKASVGDPVFPVCQDAGDAGVVFAMLPCHVEPDGISILPGQQI